VGKKRRRHCFPRSDRDSIFSSRTRGEKKGEKGDSENAGVAEKGEKRGLGPRPDGGKKEGGGLLAQRSRTPFLKKNL